MNASKNNRILWLLNHTTLRDSEVPMLNQLGFEVFVPKIIPSNEANSSASVSIEYDKTLSIPPNILSILNEFDFYTKPWPRWLTNHINEHFGIAIVAIFPKMVNEVCDAFNGSIFLRAFGLAGDATYAELFRLNLSKDTYEKIKHGDHIWIATNIATVIDNEPQWIQRKSIYLPVGLPKSLYEAENQWRGGKQKIFFVCPRINSSSYYNQVYRDFRKLLGDLPHDIAGAQPKEVNDDPNVTGFMSQEDYIESFKSNKVMYYHSKEERHLHYHPIEAMMIGMPVIFLSGGVIEFLAKQKLPGCCDTLEEARLKVKLILMGDKNFTDQVTSSQKIILREFSPDYVADHWHKSFIPLTKVDLRKEKPNLTEQKTNELKHVGIWMHETNPNGFTGEGISRLLAMIIRGAQENPNLQIHIAAVSWVKQAVVDYMEDLGVDTQRISFDLVNEKSPLIYQVYNWWTNRKPGPRREWGFPKRIYALLTQIRGTIGSRIILLRPGIGLLILAFIAIFFLPAIFLLGILFIVGYGIKKVLDNLIRFLRIERLTGFISNRLVWIKNKVLGYAPRVYAYMVDAEFKQLSEKVAHDKKFAAWFFAYPNNKYISSFQTPRIVSVPDVVYIDFPSVYARASGGLIETQSTFIEQTISNADVVITFSEYVRQNQVIKPGFQPSQNTTVIRHAPIETRYLISSRSEVDDLELRLLARRIIKNYLQKQVQYSNNKDAQYLRALNLGEIDYLFVSSQSRLHKNHINLLKAYKQLLRERYINLKLVFTGKLSEEMQEYVYKERMGLDVLSMHYVPPRVHASLYACAKLVVAPTLFEGGFPFVFSEALSVSTPIVMSDIPVVREVLWDEECHMYCFDPYNIQEITEKIQWALENHSTLLNAQTKTLGRMKARTWKDVAKEYLHVFLNEIHRG